MNEKNALWRELFISSFAVDDVILYLDTHPNDVQALRYYHEAVTKRNAAKDAYEAQFGPVTIDGVNAANGWTWEQGPWPWEGGDR